MFQQKKVYQTLENRQFTPESLASELEQMKQLQFDDVSYTGLNLNMNMLMTQHIRNDRFELIEVQNGLAKKTFENWHQDLVLAIKIFNHFADETKAHFQYFVEESKKFQEETGYSNTSREFKDYFEQGNSMYFHDVLHSVFDLSRRLDLSIEDFEQALKIEGESLEDYPLPEKKYLNETFQNKLKGYKSLAKNR
ncbi:hypothetical protein [Vagococcus lutrae]|uniref:hypothetical protein n=1 Tax=Vagococcus lutrae TaxID=81947 RepID=UPI002010B6D0|nr:hypothetical protein [Vagococcus lutrae]MDT2806706.1 hypothetical protein [Vagococcus lutrae]MDT2823779.1 hypothetical protein [Vagococcus lutrae]UQF19704.1 hypothetical protein M2905_04630 [Vagococcus lutrae]